MKKRNFKKRFISMMLCMVMLLSLAFSVTGCGGKEEKSGISGMKDFTFPLEEEVTFTFMVQGSRSATFDDDLANNALWKKLKEETNVNIEFQFLGDDSGSKLAMLVNSGEYGDVLVGGPVLNSIESSLYLSSGIFVPLDDYVNEKYMPNLTAILADRPETKKVITSAEGEIVTIPRMTDMEGWYLESPLWINKKWLDNLGLSVPTTIDEFTNVLRAFATKDPNGNGVADEVPYFIANSMEYYSFDAFLGCWGLATKSGTNDSYVQVVDGKVQFVPSQEAYKEALKYMAQLYGEGLIYQEAFTATSQTATAKLTSTTCVVGCFTSNTLPTTDYVDDYICILPPTVEGYEPCWYYHYGMNGSKNFFYLTDNCENPAVLMAWMDKLYELENGVALEYGLPEEGRVSVENGVYNMLDLDSVTSAQINKEHPTLYSLTDINIRAFNTYGDTIAYSAKDQVKQDCYKLYSEAGVINTDIWPRPYYQAEDANRLSELCTDIFYTVSNFRAKVIAGTWDADAKWNEYISDLEGQGLDKFVEMQQNAYDAYNGS